ncbi:MAG TPA: hypothetical protein PLQ80_07070 [Candidatus Syntrophosphaera sp.]|nr:hypothetical protein [Candidatus Syntrophosphaera sp.]
MKTNTTLLLIIFSVLVLSSGAKNVPIPDWYCSRSLQTAEHELIGYGSDRSPDIAKAQAKKEIAMQIEVQVRSEGKFTLAEINGVVNETAETLISEQVNINLESVYTIREEKLKKIYYCALGYDNSPLVHKFAKLMPTAGELRETKNNYLLQTPFIKDLGRISGKHADIRLQRSKERWWISCGDVFMPLPALEIDQFFTQYGSPCISLSSNVSPPFQEGQRYQLELRGSDSGYYSLFIVYENGMAYLLEGNRFLPEKGIWRYPDGDLEMQANLLTPGKTTIDQIVAVFSPESLDLNRFNDLSSQIVEHESFYRFGDLIDLLGQEAQEFSTLILHTIPK